MPKLDVEIFYFFGKINLYANLCPRANLVSFDLCLALQQTSHEPLLGDQRAFMTYIGNQVLGHVQVLDIQYLDKYYKTQGRHGYSMQELQLESMADPETVPFESRSIDMRVLTGQTSLFHTVSHSPLSACGVLLNFLAAIATVLWHMFPHTEI